MEQQQKFFEDSGFAPSFSYYSSDSKTSTALAKVIREEQELAQINENGDIEGDDFEFSLYLSDEEISTEEIASRSWTVSPVSDLKLFVTVDIDREIKETDANSTTTRSLRKLFVDEPDESSSSYSSSESDELDSPRSRTYCMWRPKADGGSSPVMSKCKKSSSTGSGSKRWIFRYLLGWTNNEGKQPTMLLTPTKVDSPNHKRNSGGLWKAQTVHEQFYVQRRAESEIGKKKTYLPYRKDLVGLFANVNGMGKLLPF